jgi:hypothetical protein
MFQLLDLCKFKLAVYEPFVRVDFFGFRTRSFILFLTSDNFCFKSDEIDINKTSNFNTTTNDWLNSPTGNIGKYSIWWLGKTGNFFLVARGHPIIDILNFGRGSERRRSERWQAKNFRTSKWSFKLIRTSKSERRKCLLSWSELRRSERRK